MPSQAVTLMFIPIIIGLGFSKRAAYGKTQLGEICPWSAYLEAYQGDWKEEAGKSPPPDPLLLHPPVLEAVQLGSRQEHQHQSQAAK